MQNHAINLFDQLDLNQTGVQKRAALYARVSTVEQAEEGYSIDEQINLLREWCKREGYTIYNEYVDRGISGKNIKGRPAIQQLLHDANQKAFDIVLVWKMNRLSRKSSDLLSIVDRLQNKNIGFRSYTERYETETASGRLQFQMMAAIAEFERANIAENVKMGMLARAREGSWNGGQVLGYDIVTVPSDNRKRKISKLVINEEEAQTVRKIFELYTQGNGYKSIANRLNKEGYRTKKNKEFSINGIKTILCNPIYAGYIRYNVRRDWNEKRRNNINPDPIIVKGRHTPIITETMWEKAKSIMKSRTGKPNRIHSGDFPLTGILKCPVCGAGMVLGRTTNTNKDGTKRVLEYYVCGAWKNKGTAVCRSNGVRTEYAEKYVLEKLASLANNDVLVQRIVESINRKNKDGITPLQKEYEILKKSLTTMQSKKNKILGLYEDGVLGKDDLITRLANLNGEIERLEERIAPIEEQMRQGGYHKVNFELVKQVMQNFMIAYKEALTPEQRKRLLHLLINQITISDNRKIDTIQIQLNKEVIKHFDINGGENSSIADEFSPPFSVVFAI
ncbi:recombinase family protein [Heyndrickxia sporothermodurans]|uniref:recombinase family protein n=1 Tax=Bacillaceae TaxID=186817 RepID=UPI0010F8AB94|nr:MULTISPECIES: recombinase family protein [Bacillaceae]MEB6551147.1 recombinase family protein [Heyndrickxia sporothermodurans]MED3781871.1 recombinase family protein [Heyndrickxia sporothermodurans]QTR71168.1 recombinase family protein [Bacillus cytotoxicus]HDR7314293.1 recombinase family protein [Bacillus cytotoxicus]